MRCSQPKQHDQSTSRGRCSLAKALAPEEIRPGDFVTVLHETYEVPSYYWDVDASILPPEEPVRLRLVPEGGGVPLKVKSVCLPFVLVRHPAGNRQTLDVRRCRLARLDRVYAKVTWKAYKKLGANASRKK